MRVNFSFWVPTEVSDIGHFDYSTRYQIKKKLIHFGEVIDRFFYIGSSRQELLSHRIHSDHTHGNCLQGRAKVFNLQSRVLNIEEPITTRPRFIIMTLKIVAFVLFFPILITIKACYKYLYVKGFIDQQKKYISLSKLLSAYPSDPDLICLNLCKEFGKFSGRNDTDKATYYTRLRNHFLSVIDFCREHPEHAHGQELLKTILNFQTCVRVIFERSEDCFDFFKLIKKESLGQFVNPPSLYKVFEKVHSNENEKNFFLLCKVYFVVGVGLLSNTSLIYSILPYSQYIVPTILNQEEYLGLIRWMIEKQQEEIGNFIYIYSYGNYLFPQTLLQTFHHYYLRNFEKPYSQPVQDLEQRFLQLDQDLTLESQERVLLSNLFGIGGYSSLHGSRFSLEGFRLETRGVPGSQTFHPVSDLVDYVFPFLETTINRLSSRTGLKEPLELLQRTLRQSPPDFHALVCGNPTDHPNKLPHAWSQVRYKEYLLIGNQGYASGEFPGIMIFKINPEKFDPANSKLLQLTKAKSPMKRFFFSREPMSGYLNQEYFAELSPQWVGYIPLPYQKMANCPWKAFRLNLLSTLFILGGYESLKAGENPNLIVKRLGTKSLINKLSRSIRKDLLQRYVTRHSRGSGQQPDHDLLKKIADKAVKKRWSLFQRLLSPFLAR